MRYFRLLATLFVFAMSVPAFAAEVKVLRFNGVINPIAAEYLGGSVATMNRDKSADFIVIMLDTPGGLDTSMRIIVKEIMASQIPVAVYVAPSGSRAASAGAFIAMSAHISAMAPGTSQGSAHPVAMGGEKMDETMSKKVEHDAAAYIKSLAIERGRNAQWAEMAVRKSVSLGEKDALAQKVTDIVAKDLDDLLRQANGRAVKMGKESVTLDLSAPHIAYIDMTQRQKVLDTISNPTVAYILLMLGFYGLFFELANPGVILPGVIGGICLILGFYSMQSLPVNYAAILLLLLGVIMFIAEVFVVSHGALAIGGIISIVLGATMLIDAPADYMKVQLSAIIPIAMVMGGLIVAAVAYGIFFKPRRVPTGIEGLMGSEGIALSALNPAGQVEVDGEIWSARSSGGEIAKGEKITVLRKEKSVLMVERKRE
ncbi:MAG: nodulation protein NfeD [Nitrospinae bacterium]|nr:nodulation protein NfeD [Nitrospinota bacterium]